MKTLKVVRFLVIIGCILFTGALICAKLQAGY